MLLALAVIVTSASTAAISSLLGAIPALLIAGVTLFALLFAACLLAALLLITLLTLTVLALVACETTEETGFSFEPSR